MKRKLTIQLRRIRHVCTLQNTCRPHVIKTIKRHYVHIWIFLAGTFGARKKWLRLVEKGLGSQARTIATLKECTRRRRGGAEGAGGKRNLLIREGPGSRKGCIGMGRIH